MRADHERSERKRRTVLAGWLMLMAIGALASLPKPHACGLVSPQATGCRDTPSESTTSIYLRRLKGDLLVTRQATTDTYEAYFHIPIAFADQVPVLLTVRSPQLVDYRFVRLSPPNVIVAARMKSARQATIHWESWVIVRQNDYLDRPATKPIPTLDQLPDEVKPWLLASDCVQTSDPFVQGKAQTIRGDTTDLMVLADRVAAACSAIPASFKHSPPAFDAFYALKWGNSCTGTAHAGDALMRANGVPARTLMVMPTWYGGAFDMHWIIEYYVPDYGWVRMETTLGQNPVSPVEEIVVLACNPEDEFPLFYPDGLEGYWHTSDPSLGVAAPRWGQSHHAFDEGSVGASTEDADKAIALGKTVFDRQVDTWGLTLPQDQQAEVQAAYGYQSQALAKIRARDMSGFLSEMQNAADAYGQVTLNPMHTIFYEDFETGENGWTHGGVGDTWAWGTPSSKPPSAHSGDHCWGTGFSGTYANNADAWLLSPPIDLRGQACAYVSVWLYNWVQDGRQKVIKDPLWMEITTDGSTFLPLCSQMGGVNEDPEIPAVGGWTRMVLDLSKYIGNDRVQARFHFRSDGSITLPGSYIDDFEVYGRAFGAGGSPQARQRLMP